MRLAQDETLAFEPGTGWSYSNSGFLILGKVIEVVTRRNYYDYVRGNIYQPAGMVNTDCYELDRVNPNLAVGYEREYFSDGLPYKNNLFRHVIRGGPAGGGYSTVEDLLKFDNALRSSKLVAREYVELLLSSKPELTSPEYGFGFIVDQRRKIAGHSGGFPGVSSTLLIFLDTEHTAVVLSNYSGGAQPVSEKIRELVLASPL
ncbi:MAG TPA: serine hydrolase domain-containing protein [Blastocatellia bacterium]|jgi:CubicO group peptidase (beta-lactamase class C family)|nr:serine hydrolase domain-containing protein [Blastocatellia bacterium]